MADSRLPRLAISLGDPRGIGPEIVRKALHHERVARAASYTIVGPAGAGADVDVCVGNWSDSSAVAAAGHLAGSAIVAAVDLAQRRRVDGLVTAPIDKAALLAGGFSDPGHTEMLARLTGCRTAMMLASSKLRVVLATTHIPLRDVPDALTEELLAGITALVRRDLTRLYGIAQPRIALCALNPHAGDQGRFGTEDDTVLAPAARKLGLGGPFPADTVFVRAIRGEFDCVIAPYHDVGMTAIKVASFGEAVNVTLGLPFPRTSPDHGTALDIAGKGKADASSMIAAIEHCIELVKRSPAPSPAS